MDYNMFEKAMERAGKALFLDKDTERCMKIMRVIINKFDPQRRVKEVCPSLITRAACFWGAFTPRDMVSIHISMARLFAATGELRLLYTTLQQLLVLSSYWWLRTPVLPALFTLSSIDSHNMITNTPNSIQLPPEIWCEVVSWLSRPHWKTLLCVSHPLRKFAANLLFRDLVLQFDVYGYHPGDARLNSDLDELEAWHSKRSLDIMTRILLDRRFAYQVRTLKILMCDYRLSGPTNVMEFNIVCLSIALSRMPGLKELRLYGSPIFLRELVSYLPRLSRGLQSVTVKYQTYGGQVYFPRVPIVWDRLEQLSLHPIIGVGNSIPLTPELHQISKTLRRLRMAHRSSPTRLIALLADNLTHLELISSWGGPSETSLFQVVLGSCARLESLRLIGCPLVMHSIYFRQYPRALPWLRDFGIRFAPAHSVAKDPDFFLAICDFLRDRPILESLELLPYSQEIGQTIFGFDVRVWEFLSSLQHLRILSTFMLNTIPHQRMVHLIPRSVTTLTVSMCDWHLELLLRKDGWPKDLRFFGFNERLHESSISIAKKIANSVSSIRVVRIADDYFSVTGRKDGKPVRVDQWSSRATRIFRKEYLESHGCDDHEYLYVNHNEFLP